MIVVVDERELVKDGYTSLFGREGIPSTGFDPNEFGEWVQTAADSDIAAVEAFLIGQGQQRHGAAAGDPRPLHGAGDRGQRSAIAGKHTCPFLIAASTTSYANRCIRARSWRVPRQSAAA